MKLTWHDAGRIIGSMIAYVALTLLFGLSKDCLFLGVPIAAILFPVFNLGGEVEQAQAEKKVTLDHLFDVLAALCGIPIALADIGEGSKALIISIILFVALAVLWKYRVPREDGGQSSPTVTKL
jgi:FtsH-binding integral membrane protein